MSALAWFLSGYVSAVAMALFVAHHLKQAVDLDAPQRSPLERLNGLGKDFTAASMNAIRFQREGNYDLAKRWQEETDRLRREIVSV